jgi:DNA-binding MarR family transcriptional regulator
MRVSASEADKSDLPAHRSAAEILAHPRFPITRSAQVEALLALYEHDAFLNRLLLQAGRRILFDVIMCLAARCNEADPSTWPTLRLITRSMADFNVASPRRIADLVTRFIKTGYLKQFSSPRDRRIRVLRPTERMIAYDRDWLVSHYVPLQVLFPDPGYGLVMQHNPVFQRALRSVAAGLFSHAAQVMARNPIITQFMLREAGMMIIIKLVQLVGPNQNAPREITYSDIGAQFGVSRTHVRKLLHAAEKNGLVRLTQNSGQHVQLTPKLIGAFDRFLADSMADNDLVYELARRAADTEPRPAPSS